MGVEINTAANPSFLPNATSTSDGAMSAADKVKLDSLGPSGGTGNFTFVGNTMDLIAPAVMQIGDVTTTGLRFDTTTGPYTWQFGSVDKLALSFSAGLLQLGVAAAPTDTAGTQLIIRSGAAGAASASPGNDGGLLGLSGGAGANGTAIRAAGAGGEAILVGGDAGTNNGFAAGDGGPVNVVGGTGSAASGAAAGGTGGSATVQGGTGGAASATGAAGSGAQTTVTGGNGGDSLGSTLGGGFGGQVALRGGAGGAGAVTAAAGDGGDVVISAGFGGTANGGPGGSGGSTFLRGGLGTGGANGVVNVGDTATSSITLGASAVTSIALSSKSNTFTGTDVANGATPFITNTTNTYTSGNRIASFRTGGTEKALISAVGNMFLAPNAGVDMLSAGTLFLGQDVATTVQVGGGGSTATVNIGNTNVPSTTVVFGKFNLNHSTVTQITSITTSVIINASSGVITTVSSTLAAQANATFTVTNNTIVAASVVNVSLGTYSGTFGTNGTPLVSVPTVAAGSFSITIYNAHASNALSGTLKIHFIAS